jgi:hemerythrin-like metal-binding protein
LGNWFTSLFGGKKKEQEKPDDLITWSKAYEVGHELIDQQHQTLVNMINELNQVVAGQGTREDVGKILSKLVNYTVFHFGAEEELFKDTDYPHTEAHIKKHEELVQKVSTFQDEFAQNRTEVSDELLNFLTDWLIQHIHGTDRGYKDYI